MVSIVHLCTDGKLAGEGESQSFDPKEIGITLKQNIPDYLNMCYYQGKESKPFL